MEKTAEKKKRLPYHKPRLEEVPLKPEEAVLDICKTNPPAGEVCVNQAGKNLVQLGS